MELKKRHGIAAAVLRPLLRLFFRLRYNVRSAPFLPAEGSKPPYLILCNHNSDLDPFFIAACFKFPVYFVASDHIFRLGIVSALIRYLVSPIPKLKPAGDLKTVRDIVSILRSGGSVCVFPEGNRSWNGETESISPAIGKLAHRLSVPLVLCRIRGGYLFSPRWADHLRRGRVECFAARELSPEEIKGMSVGELNDLIRNELHVDAMADQAGGPVRFLGKHLAQSVETLLFACPGCGRFSSIRSKGDGASCACGLRFKINELGYLVGAPFKTLAEWDAWQLSYLRGKLRDFILSGPQVPFFRDGGQRLYRIKRAEKNEFVDKGELCMYGDRIVFRGLKKSFEFFFSNISDVTIRGRLVLQFTLLDGSPYEIKSERLRSAYKYIQAYRLLRRRDRQGSHAAL